MAGLFKKCRHPFVSLAYFVAAVSFSLVYSKPVFLGCSLAAAFVMNLYLKNWNGLKAFLKLVPFFAVLSCLNPLVAHWGETVLFNLWGNPSKPVTLEALLYGLNSGLMMMTVALWCFAFSKVLTSEKLTYIFAPVFPALSIMFVMILRLIPFYSRRASEISDGRKGLGLEKGKSLWQKLKEKMSVLNAVTSSTLEDGRYTADSMVERGWGKAKRSSFIQYRFGMWDLVLCVVLVCAVCGCLWWELGIKN